MVDLPMPRYFMCPVSCFQMYCKPVSMPAAQKVSYLRQTHGVIQKVGRAIVMATLWNSKIAVPISNRPGSISSITIIDQRESLEINNPG